MGCAAITRPGPRKRSSENKNTDDIDKCFYPFGRNDLLEVAQFMAHNGRFAWNGNEASVIVSATRQTCQVRR